jgi:methyl-accepting chemotaxis protein
LIALPANSWEMAMITWFTNLKIFQKLMLAFSLIGALVIVLGTFSVIRLSDLNSRLVDMNENWMPAIRSLMSIEISMLDMRTNELAQSITLQNTPAGATREAMMVDFKKRKDAYVKKVKADRDRYTPTITGPQEKALWDAAAGKINAYLAADEKFDGIVATGNGPAAEKALDDTRALRRDMAEDLDKVIAFNSENADKVVVESQQAFSSNRFAVISGTVLVVLLGLVLGYGIARMISRPMRRASEVAKAVAKGELEDVVIVNSRDEVGELLSAMAEMQSTIKSVVAAQSLMAEKHDAGTISYRIDHAGFPGAFGVMTRQTNDMVAQHIAVKMRVVDVVRAYSEGNFAVEMERLPGEKAKIT